MHARQAAAPRKAQLQACSLVHMQEGVQGVVKEISAHPPLIRPTSVWKVAFEVVGPRFDLLSLRPA